MDAMAGASTLQFLGLLPVAIILWGIALLAALAGLAGAGGHPARRDLASGAARGFFVFLLAVSGHLIFAWGYGEPAFRFPNQETYFRIAGLVSVGAFVVGWSPEIVSEAIVRYAERKKP